MTDVPEPIMKVMQNIADCLDAFTDMPVVLNKIAIGEYYAVALDLKYPSGKEIRVYAVDLINPYYRISPNTFRLRSLKIQQEFNDYGIFHDRCCGNC